MGVFFPLILNLLWSLYRVYRSPGGDSVVAAILAIALLLMFFSLRVQLLTVQDRVIRLEMRLRLRELLPPDLRPQIASLTVPQLIALRFASDQELPELVREVLAGRMATQKEIKGRVKEWQADYMRA
jgi:hypothetical protein